MAASLVDMARRACMKNSDSIVDVGDLPYDMVRPFLRKIVDPEQLRLIVSNCPHIAGQDAELWQAFIKRDIPKWEKKWIEPSKPELWWKVYRKLLKEDNEERAVAEESLRAALNKSKVDKAANQAQILHRVIPTEEPKPRRYGYGPAKPKTHNWGQSKPTAIGQQALRNAKTGHDALAVIRRQASHQHQVRGTSRPVPTNTLNPKMGTVTQAPRQMLDQYNKKANQIKQPVVRQNSRPAIIVPRMGASFTSGSHVLNGALLAQQRADQAAKEQRLRALTGASGPKTFATPTSTPSQPTPQRSSASTKALTAESQDDRPIYQPRKTTSPPAQVARPKKRPAAAMFTNSTKKVKR